jgi:hypothetical protein
MHDRMNDTEAPRKFGRVEVAPRRHAAWADPWLRSVRYWIRRIAEWAEPGSRGGRWIPLAAAIGAAPFLAFCILGRSGHQFVSALGLALLVFGCARRDAWIKGMAAITLAFLTHSAVVIAVAYHAPGRTAAMIPNGADYWTKQHTWITTGIDPEYKLATWVPDHAKLAAAMVVLGMTSFGTSVYYEGFIQVDLMNYYNAQLIAHSASGPLALVLGWHVWSILRGVGFVFLAFEVASLSLEYLGGLAVSTRRARLARWGFGLSFLLADGVVKALITEPVRQAIANNLLS